MGKPLGLKKPETDEPAIDPVVDDAPDMVTLDTSVIERPSVVTELERLALACQRSGDWVGDASLMHVAVAAGALKEAIKPNLNRFTGDAATLLLRLYETL